MKVSEMHLQFKLGVDKADSLNSPNFLPEEIDVYLSNAQEEFIEQRAYGNNPKRESVEETQKRVKDLQSLTKNAVITPLASTTDNKPNGLFVVITPLASTTNNPLGLLSVVEASGVITAFLVKLCKSLTRF